MALFMIFYKGKHTQLGDNQKRGDTKRGDTRYVANYNIGFCQEKFSGSLGHLAWASQQLPKSLLGRMDMFTMRQIALAC